MASNDDLSQHRFALNAGRGVIPALGFGTSLSDRTKTRDAVKTAIEVGFRHLDAAERYRVAPVSPAMGNPGAARDGRGHPVGVRFAGARAGTATARRPTHRLDGSGSGKDSGASASGVGYPARQRGPDGIVQPSTYPGELRRQRASRECNPGDQRASRNSLPIQLRRRCGRAGVC
jgi:hypothetical protein